MHRWQAPPQSSKADLLGISCGLQDVTLTIKVIEVYNYKILKPIIVYESYFQDKSIWTSQVIHYLHNVIMYN